MFDMSEPQAAAFYREVAKNRKMWTVFFPDGRGSLYNGSIPFWSSLSRTNKMISRIEWLRDGKPVEVSWERFLEHWMPQMIRDGFRIGVNWSGERAAGYDIEPELLRETIQVHIDRELS